MVQIEPYEFGQVEWYSNGLLKHHINEYLNLMTSEPSSCLISQSVSTTYNIKVGDSITVSNTGASPVILNVYGIVDYWPSWNPNKDASSPASSKVKAPML